MVREMLGDRTHRVTESIRSVSLYRWIAFERTVASTTREMSPKDEAIEDQMWAQELLPTTGLGVRGD
jgi:hypothetical protein